jgi:ATP-dependent RNA helicase DDX49/DBP8
VANYFTFDRELAFQISEQFAALGAPFNLSTAVVVGGMDMIAQALELRERPHVVVATPGRIVDHLRSSSGEWDLSRVKFLVSPLAVCDSRGPVMTAC